MKRLVLLVVLAGCPANHSFNGHIVTTTVPLASVVLDRAGNVVSPELAPVANARIDCTGCSKRAITVDAKGRFSVGGSDGPMTLRVAADGYEPVELELAKVPIASQAGLAEFVIVLRRK